MFVLINFHINTTKSQKQRQVLKKMFNVNGQKLIFRWNSSGYKLRGNICRKNVVGLVLWDNRQFPRPQAWGSFRHRLSLSLCFSPAERQICTCFFAFRGLSKDWQPFIITKVEHSCLKGSKPKKNWPGLRLGPFFVKLPHDSQLKNWKSGHEGFLRNLHFCFFPL